MLGAVAVDLLFLLSVESGDTGSIWILGFLATSAVVVVAFVRLAVLPALTVLTETGLVEELTAAKPPNHMPYVEPKGKIVSTSESDGVSRLVIEFDRDRSTVHFRELDIDIGPAGLYIDPRSGNEQFQLHRVVGNEGLVYTFETFNRTHPMPKVGEVFSYRGWWQPDATDAALDTSEKWVKKKYPDNGDHEHCLFSWEHISSYDECDEGYFSERYGWITCDSYKRFVEGDIYHLRDSNAYGYDRWKRSFRPYDP